MNKYKVRTRFNIVDIAMLCDTLRKTILGTRISNIYDCQPTSMSPRSYIIKLSGTPIGAPSSSSLSTTAQSTSGKEDDAILNTKHMLLLDPPCRMHVTEYVRPKKDVPSILSLKLRKYIRGKRLEKITQLGIDRVIQLTFGVGESSFNLIIELYAQGNIVLTDSAYTILAVLRHHEYGDGASIAVKSTYPLSFVKHLPDDSISSFSLIEKTIEKITTEISLKEANDAKKEDVESEEKGTNEDNDDGENDISQQSKKKGQKKGGNNNNKGKQQQQQQQKKKVDPCYTVLDIIRNIVDFGTHFNNEIVSSTKSIQDPNRNLLKTPLTEEEKADLATSLSAHFLKFKRMHAGLESLTPGYVLLRPSEEKKDEKVEEKAEEKSAPADKSGDSERYYDFAPIEYSDCEGIERIEFANFDIALDRFFTQLEVAQMARQQANLESTMGKKLEKLKRDQEERIAGLEDAAERLKKNAMLIEYNIPLVDQAINELRAVIASGLPWTEIELMVKTLKKTDPTSIANIIHHLVLRENRAFLLLSEPSEDDEAEHDATSVPVDLSLSAHGNIEACYTERSGWLSKAKKTTDVSDQVIEKAEKKYKNDLKKARANASVNPYSGSGGFLQVRKKFWFEKFNWFVSAEGLVVVSGKDAQQNETLYKRYMRQNDVYVHADIHGAATCIIRSRQDVNGGAIGPVTLEQAGRFAMCRSNAWSSKLVTSAWWVYPSQVSKSAPTGEYLTTGSFMIRGKKNFLPPHQLVMGFGLLFLLDPSSLEAHKDDTLAGSALDSTQVSSSSLLSSSSSSALLSGDDAEGEQQQQQQEKEDENPKDSSNDDKASVITFVESDMPEPTAKEEDWSSMAESDILSNEPSTLSIGDSGKQQQSKVEESESRMEDLEEEEEEVEVVEEEKSSSAVGAVRHQQPKSKYFDDEDETNNDDAENGSNDVIDELMKSSGGAGKKDRKPKMSAHARRALKKGIDPTQKSESEETDKKKQQQQQQKKKKGGRKGRGGDDNDSDDDSTVSKQEPPAKPKPKLSKAKLKKLKKYADQDEEDRRMRMMLIGHAPKDTKEDNDEDNIEDIDLLTGNTTKKAQKKQQQQQKQAKSCFICGSKDHYARDCPKKKLEEQKAAIESENAMKSAKKVEADNIDVDDDDDDDNDGAAGNLGGAGAGGNYSDGIERLTAIPRSDDILLHAIPVCAPYDALQNYKYKVKLTPGHLKRGKAVDSAIQLFLKQQDVTEQEKRLIKAIPHDDLLQCMLSDVTVAGGQASARLKKLKKK